MPLGVVMIFQVAKAKGYHIKDPLVLEMWDISVDYIAVRYELCVYVEACLLQRWLNYSKGINVFISIPPNENKYGWKIKTDICIYAQRLYDTYDEALLDGVKQALKILK